MSYVVDMDSQFPRRRIHISLHPVLVSRLDSDMVGDRVNGFYWSRSDLIEVAVERFLEQGGVNLMHGAVGRP